MKIKYLFGLMLVASCFINMKTQANAVIKNNPPKRPFQQAFFTGTPVNKHLEGVKNLHKGGKIDTISTSGPIKHPIPISKLILDTTNGDVDFDAYNHKNGNDVLTTVNPVNGNSMIQLGYNNKTGKQSTSNLTKTNLNQGRKTVIVANPNNQESPSSTLFLPELSCNPFDFRNVKPSRGKRK